MSESVSPIPARPEKADAAPAAAAAAPARSPLAAWLPVLAVLLLAPVSTWAVAEFVLVPRLQRKFETAGRPTEAPPAAHSTGKAEGEAGGKEGGGATYEFQNMVVNLAGTMGTRYLKTSFLVRGVDGNTKAAFEGAKPQLTDVTLNVLSSLSLADLEEPGAKNVLREKLVSAYNQALGRKVAEQVYFSDFVVQ